jgi:hypothetical protein
MHLYSYSQRYEGDLYTPSSFLDLNSVREYLLFRMSIDLKMLHDLYSSLQAL